MANTRHSIAEQIKPGKKLSIELISLIFSGYLLIALTITTWQIVMEFNNEYDHLSEQIHSLSTTFQATVSEALWNYDEQQINAAMQGIYRNNEVAGISIQSNPDNLYQLGIVKNAAGIREQHTGVEPVKKTTLTVGKIYDVLYEKSYDIYAPNDEKENLGTMTVYYRSTTVIERTYPTIVLSIISALIKTMSLWLITYWIINRKVSKPIKHLQQEMVSLDIHLMEMDQYSPPSQEEAIKENEFYLLKSSYQTLCWELKNKNLKVQEQTQNLENIVQQRTQDLTQTLRELEASNKAKTAFLMNISHELRTPLNAIIGFSRRIIKSEIDHLAPRSQEAIKSVLHSGEHLLFLINDLLDMAKAESGKLEVYQQVNKIQPLLSDIENTMQSLAQDKGITLKVEAASVTDCYCDIARIKQVLLNLLSNAIKFTYEGCVSLENHPLSRDNRQGVEFIIRDTGTGIAESDLPKIFVEFEQLGNAKFGNITGTGLGLAIVKKLVDLHNGHIHVESVLGEGSAFHVWLPLRSLA